MPIGSNNEFPSVLIKEGTVPASPASGDQRIYLDSSDHKLKRVNSGGTITTIEGAGASGALTQIQKTTIGSAAAFSFTSIPGTYSVLRLVIRGRVSSGVSVYGSLRFNTDTAAHYDYADMFYQSGAGGANAVAQTALRLGILNGSDAAASYASGFDIVIPGYADTAFYKSITGTFTGGDATLAVVTGLISGFWRSTAAVTQIDTVETYATGSVGILYGMS